jgi:hypothetical protein
MALIDSFEKSGNYLFKYRGHIPLIVFALAVPVALLTPYSEHFQITNYKLINYVVCFTFISLGHFIRARTVGRRYLQTSGRNRSHQVASNLNTTGWYSIVRHPLYLGNALIWLGIVCFLENVWFVINELEGLVAKRISAERAADFMVSTATSIFLKETDSSKFRGVMLCSSNHIDHVDAALMRRMTFKINMVEPDKETRAKIIANRFPFLKQEEVNQLCSAYNLTGASIENVAEKYILMEKIGQLENRKGVEVLHEICVQEISLKTPSRNPIGFGIKN